MQGGSNLMFKKSNQCYSREGLADHYNHYLTSTGVYIILSVQGGRKQGHEYETIPLAKEDTVPENRQLPWSKQFPANFTGWR